MAVENHFANEIAVEWRDIALADNIAKIYCSALKEEKSLWVVVGLLHMQTLPDLLRNASSHRVEVVISNNSKDNLSEEDQAFYHALWYLISILHMVWKKDTRLMMCWEIRLLVLSK